MKTIYIVILSILMLISCSAYAQRDDAALADSCLQKAGDSYEADTVKKYAGIAYSVAQRLDDSERIRSAINNLAMVMTRRKTVVLLRLCIATLDCVTRIRPIISICGTASARLPTYTLN